LLEFVAWGLLVRESETLSAKEPLTDGSEQVNDSKGKILIVEDSPTQSLLLEHMLETNGYRVSVARNGREALECLQRARPSMVITDVVMPEMDGYELCSAIKADTDLRSLPVILLTKLSDPIDVLKGLEVGADNFITKPYDEDELIPRIRYILANRAVRRASGAEIGIKITFAGKDHFLTAERIQIIDFLIASLEAAVRNYHEIKVANKLLQEANQQIQLQAEELRALSLTDELTGLNNRRGFMTLADQQLKVAKRAGWETALIFADIDNLKEINDTQGHQEGDKALVDTANIMRKTFRESDIIGRLGGDEFAVLLVCPPNGSAVDPTTRLKEALEEFNRAEERTYELSLSLGQAGGAPENPTSVDELISQADRAMYEDKRRSRSNHSKD
jgi:two-component system cell cycle response regulator